MLTLLHIIESLANFGGTPRKLLYLTRHLDVGQCRQIFLCYLPSTLKNEFERHGAIVECLDSTSMLTIVRMAVHLVNKHSVDAICTHFTRPLIAGYATALATGVPVIHNEHSSAHYRKGLGRFAAKIILPRIHSVVCNSHYTLESVRKEISIPSNRLLTIHNPVEQRSSTMSRNACRVALEISENELVVCHVGGMIPQRDQITLIKAFAQIRDNFTNSRLIMIGDGPLRLELESLTDQLGLASCIQFVGYTDKIGDYLLASDIYVNPTLDEGFGIAVVEAMFAELPVVLSDRGAHPELIENEISGLLYSGGDVVSLTGAIYRLAENQKLRKSLGEAARIRASINFHPDAYAATYFEHARNVIAKPNSAGHKNG